MFRARTADTDIIGFLKSIVTDQVCRHLPRESNQRNRIHISIGQTSYDVGHPGPRSNEHDPWLARCLGVSFSHMCRALLVARQNQLDILLLTKHVEYLQDHTARESKDSLDPFVPQCFNKNIGSGLLHSSSY